MNRIITFRGRRLDGKGWAYGGYAFDSGRVYITSPIQLSECRLFEWLEVVPETLGQYTGFTDKNGSGIYEGDIVGTTRTLSGWLVAWPVVFHFDGWRLGGDKWMPSRPNKSFWGRSEIAGNIHQHPHLLTNNQ